MTSHEYLYQSIQTVLDYIEANLKNKITLDDISNEVHISKYHLNRIFHTISKNRLMRYVRMRKLSSSIKDLLNTDLRVADIALEYGFSYEQSYIRAFEQLFGFSPLRYRLQKPSVEIKDRMDLNYITKVDRGILACDPSIVLIPEFYIAGVRTKVSISDDRNLNIGNKIGNEFYKNCRPYIKNAVNSHVYIGLVEYTGIQLGYTHYTPSLQISKPFDTTENIHCIKVPTNKYVVFKYIGLHSADETNITLLKQSLNKAVSEWFFKSVYLPKEIYHIERIDETVSQEHYCEVEVYYPIKLKSNTNVMEKKPSVL